MTADLLCRSAVLLAEELALSADVRARLTPFFNEAFFSDALPFCRALTDAAKAQNAQAQLPTAGDPEGWRRLAILLGAACLTRERYAQAGIPQDVFRDTMGCFSRFIAETQARTGALCFDRSVWVWRQTACRLFRLGALEFEYRAAWEGEPLPEGLRPGQPVLRVHIPSDAQLSDRALAASYRRAAELFAGPALQFCTLGPPRAVLCGTWLLSPRLLPLLPENSGIRRFQQDYQLYADDLKDESFYLWLFGGKRPLDQLPRNTRLQRAVQAQLLEGNPIGAACGRLKTWL